MLSRRKKKKECTWKASRESVAIIRVPFESHGVLRADEVDSWRGDGLHLHHGAVAF